MLSCQTQIFKKYCDFKIMYYNSETQCLFGTTFYELYIRQTNIVCRCIKLLRQAIDGIMNYVRMYISLASCD